MVPIIKMSRFQALVLPLLLLMGLTGSLGLEAPGPEGVNAACESFLEEGSDVVSSSLQLVFLEETVLAQHTILRAPIVVVESFLSTASAMPGSDAASLCIETSLLQVAPGGVLCTGRGGDGADSIADGAHEPPEGQRGGDGGALYVLGANGKPATLDLAPGATLCTGAGGAGGTAAGFDSTLDPRDFTCARDPDSRLTALGGPGGDGGNLFLDGSVTLTRDPASKILVGAGGAGGHALALGNPNGGFSAIGGTGGASLPDSADRISGAQGLAGGAGGDAVAAPCREPGTTAADEGGPLDPVCGILTSIVNDPIFSWPDGAPDPCVWGCADPSCLPKCEEIVSHVGLEGCGSDSLCAQGPPSPEWAVRCVVERCTSPLPVVGFEPPGAAQTICGIVNSIVENRTAMPLTGRNGTNVMGEAGPPPEGSPGYNGDDGSYVTSYSYGVSGGAGGAGVSASVGCGPNSPGTAGEDGHGGGDATDGAARGGNGGPGWLAGGDGGSARLYAASGGHGGTGGAGGNGKVEQDLVCGPQKAHAGRGGDGGYGGASGGGLATGGTGGDSYIQPGRGGDGDGIPANGGNGGGGGDGGQGDSALVCHSSTCNVERVNPGQWGCGGLGGPSSSVAFIGGAGGSWIPTGQQTGAPGSPPVQSGAAGTYGTRGTHGDGFPRDPECYTGADMPDILYDEDPIDFLEDCEPGDPLC